jgi:hypothetical protein
MDGAFDSLANVGEIFAIFVRRHARDAFWICLVLGALWLLRCALIRPPVVAQRRPRYLGGERRRASPRLPLREWFFPLATLLALAGFLFFLPLRGASWYPYQVTTEWFLLPALVLALVGTFLSPLRARADTAAAPHAETQACHSDPDSSGEESRERSSSARAESPTAPTINSRRDRSPILRDALWLLGFLAVGLFLRTYHLADLPRGFLNEYADGTASAIQTLITGKPFFIRTFHASGLQYMHFMRNPYLFFSDAWALAFALFGVSMTVFRGVVVVIGLGFLATLYAYVRSEFGAVEARIATALATISVWCLALSRDGWPQLMFSPLLFAALLWTWGQALRTAKWSWYAASTFLLALSLYGYRVNYVFPVLVLGQVVFAALRGGKGFWRQHWARLAASTAFLALALIPLLHYIFVQKYFALISSQAVWGTEPSIQAPNAWIKLLKKLLVFFGTETMYARCGQGWRLDMVPALGGGHGWLFHPLMSTVALVGLACAVRSIKDERYLGLLLAFVLAPMPGFLSHPITRRVTLLVVPMFTLAGVGGACLLEALRAGFPARLRRLPALIFAVALAAILAANAAGFRTVLNSPGYTEMQPIAEWTARLIPQNYVYVVVQSPNDREYVQFATYEKTHGRFEEAWQLVPWSFVTKNTVLHPAGKRPAVFLVQWSPKLETMKEQVTFWEQQRRSFPDIVMRVLQLYPEPEPFLATRLLMLKVPAKDARRVPPLLEQFYRSPKSPAQTTQ